MLLSALLSSFALAQDAPAAEAPPAAASAVTYDLKGFLGVLVAYDRGALMAGHDHAVAPNAFSGTVTYNPADPSACNIAISFPVTALQVDPAGSRGRFGLEGDTKDGDKKSIKSNLEGKHQLEANKYPTVSFQSTSCKANGEKVAVSGKLNLHGVAAPVTAQMRIKADATSFSAKGGFTANHSTWSFDPFTALLGSLRNAPELKFKIDVSGSPKG